MTQTEMLKTVRGKMWDPGLRFSYLYPHHQMQFINHSRYSTLELEAINNEDIKINKALWRY